jgi:hypothetical protein
VGLSGSCKQAMQATSRCQVTKEEQFKPCYASVLVATEDPEKLEALVQKVEEKIWPSLTFWCLECKKPCLITRDSSSFKTMSEHHVHQVKLLEIIQKCKLFE